MTYGLRDTVDRSLWIGDVNGPFRYDDQMTARIAAQLYDEMVGNDPGRTRAEPYECGIKVMRDTVDAKMSAEEALRHIEEDGKAS